jgi:hypothetical protein
VDVVAHVGRKFEVDDVGESRQVEPSSPHLGRHSHPTPAVEELPHHLHSLLTLLVAVERLGGDPIRIPQLLTHDLDAVRRVDE